ncbi:MAG: NAD-dependent epimerase/dehydratase family protein, partial [Planctomycetes bacterium]|nr:NAD-dependent epimerase/dehydratase family protein [Planctomycetota bacterium]
MTAPTPGRTPATSPDRGGRRNTAILITGAGGEVGHGLISSLHGSGHCNIVALDVKKLRRDQRELCQDSFEGDICDNSLLERLLAMYE